MDQLNNSNPKEKTMEIHKQEAKIIYDYSHNPKRKTPRIIQDFSETVSLTDQHTASMNDLNYLVQRYTPDELTNYLIAKGRSHPPIQGHDFSKEPSLQDAMNEVIRIKKIYNDLPQEIQAQFKNPLDFVKFVDNPQNAQRLVKMGLLQTEELPQQTTTNQTTTNQNQPSEKPDGANSQGDIKK